jgi:hypothetical protein
MPSSLAFSGRGFRKQFIPGTAVQRTCKDCDSTFKVGDFEQDWLRAKGISLPRRCPACRSDRRKLADQVVNCEGCDKDFDLPKELAMFASTFGWDVPTRHPLGCPGVDESRRKLRGDRLKLAKFWEETSRAPTLAERLAEPPKEASSPEDLFKGFDAMVAAAAEAEASALRDAAAENSKPIQHTETSGGMNASLASRAHDDLPSPDDLFPGLKK